MLPAFRTLPLPPFPVGATLCVGIGAPEVAAPEIDWRLASEIEAFPRAVLAARFGYRLPEDHNQGDALLWGDMATLAPETWRDRGLPLPDVLVAGTPCQAFSLAGARGGLSDPRGNLTLCYVRLCHAIADARRDGRLFTVWENVPGVLSSKDNAFGCLLGGIVGGDPVHTPDGKPWPRVGMVAGPRGRAAWRVLNAEHFGCAQRRKRVFLVASLGDGPDPAAILFEQGGANRDAAPRRPPRSRVAARAGRGADGPVTTSGQLSFCLNAGGMGRCDLELETMVVTDTSAMAIDLQQVTSAANGSVPRPVAPTLAAGGCAALVTPALRKLTPPECHILQGFPVGHCDLPGAADGAQYKALGNSMAVPVMRWLLHRAMGLPVTLAPVTRDTTARVSGGVA